jgi:hypothetical protein
MNDCRTATAEHVTGRGHRLGTAAAPQGDAAAFQARRSGASKGAD